MKLEDAWFYMVVDAAGCGAERLGAVVGAAIEGGVDIVELRVGSGADSGAVCAAVAAVCRELDALLVLGNTLQVEQGPADGLRVIDSGMVLGQARAVVGQAGFVGVSTADMDGARLAEEAGADFVLLDVAAAGLDAARAARAVVNVPLYPAGVTLDLARDLVDGGFYRLCVDSAVLEAGDVRESAAVFARMLGREM